jgi:hypothetical protein
MIASNDVADGAAAQLGMFSTFFTTSLRRLNLGCGLALDMPCVYLYLKPDIPEVLKPPSSRLVEAME